MAVLIHSSAKALETYLQTFDASAEVHVPNDISEALALIETPPVGKLLFVGDAGGNTLVIVFTTSGALAGVNTVRVKGNFYLTTTLTAFAAPVLAKPVEVRTHASVKALEDYLKAIDATATVSRFADISQAAGAETGAKFVTSSAGAFTFIKGSALGSILFINNKGAEYTTVKK